MTAENRPTFKTLVRDAKTDLEIVGRFIFDHRYYVAYRHRLGLSFHVPVTLANMLRNTMNSIRRQNG